MWFLHSLIWVALASRWASAARRIQDRLTSNTNSAERYGKKFERVVIDDNNESTTKAVRLSPGNAKKLDKKLAAAGLGHGLGSAAAHGALERLGVTLKDGDESARAQRHWEREKIVQHLDKLDNKTHHLVAVPPRRVKHQKTKAGHFSVYEFPLTWTHFTMFTRRYGVDVPTECEKKKEGHSCPVLFDFHGSYDSLYSQREKTGWHEYLAQVDPKHKFILVTPEGSPDAVTYGKLKLGKEEMRSTTSWNVLGWGHASVPMSAKDACSKTNENSQCFKAALGGDSAYPCFGTRQELMPRSCRLAPVKALSKESYWKDPGAQSISRVCASSSAANDWDYLRVTVESVINNHKSADARRIYFAGQSMGGMASCQFAAPTGKYALPEALQPAAIIPCSMGGSRGNDLDLGGTVPAMLMQGYMDDTAPGSVWAGYLRSFDEAKVSEHMKRLLQDAALLQAARAVVGDEAPATAELLIEADIMSGGHLLHKYTEELLKEKEIGCNSKLGSPTAMGQDGYMWEMLQDTVHRVAGKKIDMSKLTYHTPTSSHVEEGAFKAIRFKCTNATDRVKVCTFKGGHDWPWNEEGWVESSNKGRVFHDFLWMDFLQGGTITRKSGPAHARRGKGSSPKNRHRGGTHAADHHSGSRHHENGSHHKG